MSAKGPGPCGSRSPWRGRRGLRLLDTFVYTPPPARSRATAAPPPPGPVTVGRTSASIYICRSGTLTLGKEKRQKNTKNIPVCTMWHQPALLWFPWALRGLAGRRHHLFRWFLKGETTTIRPRFIMHHFGARKHLCARLGMHDSNWKGGTHTVCSVEARPSLRARRAHNALDAFNVL
jgi:hypothetical protein